MFKHFLAMPGRSGEKKPAFDRNLLAVPRKRLAGRGQGLFSVQAHLH